MGGWGGGERETGTFITTNTAGVHAPPLGQCLSRATPFMHGSTFFLS